MASDSRLMLTQTNQEEDKTTVQSFVHSDSNYKTFLTSTNLGISASGQADIQGVPIAGFVESFINEQLKQDIQIDEVPNHLLTYFRNLQGPPKINFIVAGYKKNDDISEQQIWDVKIFENETRRMNPQGIQGTIWRGASDIMSRLTQSGYYQNPQGNYIQIPHYPIAFTYFTLQDAIDYAIYAVKTTIDTIRFQTRIKTVGGPIDVLVIKSENAWWVQRKDLHT